jgi:hypothetical protein
MNGDKIKLERFAILLFCFALLSTEILACTAVVGYPHPRALNAEKIFVYNSVSVILTVLTIILAFLKNTLEGALPAFLSFIVTGLIVLNSSVEQSGDCGDGVAEGAHTAAVIIFVCFIIQFLTWLVFRKNKRAELS